MGPTVVSLDREIGILAVTALDEDFVGRIAGWPADRSTRVARWAEDHVPDAADLSGGPGQAGCSLVRIGLVRRRRGEPCGRCCEMAVVTVRARMRSSTRVFTIWRAAS